MLMRWRMQQIGWLVSLGLAFVACTSKVKVVEPVETPTAELSTIDSLMWHRPDSAFALLLDFASSPKADSLDVFNGHYCQVLISELLYKNDYEQSNRPDLLEAVVYFDSLLLADTRGVSLRESGRRDASHASVKNAKNVAPTFAFLDARAHYINGVGYYEQGDMVQACAEYLKTLEVMEEYFGEKELVGHKARFMYYTYNRLGDLFYSQFMMESSITCFEKALSYYMIEPTSPTGVSGILNLIGVQYDMIGKKDSALYYYERAMENISDTNSLIYRNVLSSKTLLSYQMNQDVQSAIKKLKAIVGQTTDEKERLARYLTMGDIYYEEGRYDSAQYYLELVFQNNEDIVSKIRAAEFLRTIYDDIGDKEKAYTCVNFLAIHKKSDAESKAFVSNLNELFQNYLDQKKEKQTKEERQAAVRNVIKIVVPIFLVVAFVIVVMVKLRGWKLLKKQQTETNRMLEEKERQHEEEIKRQQSEAKQNLDIEHKHHIEAMEAVSQVHRMQQAALSGRLRRSNEELRDVSKQLEQMMAKNNPTEVEHSDDYSVFINAPICLYIVDLVHKQQFKSKMDYLIYKDYALSKDQVLALRDAAEKHLKRFVSQIRKQFPKLTDNDMDYCYLFLLGLNEADVSALMQRAYTTVCDRSRKINRIIEADDSLYHALRNMLNE